MRPSTPKQRDFILNLLVDRGINARAAVFGFCSTTLGFDVTGWDDVSLADASKIIDRLKSDKDQDAYEEWCQNDDDEEPWSPVER